MGCAKKNQVNCKEGTVGIITTDLQYLLETINDKDLHVPIDRDFITGTVRVDTCLLFTGHQRCSL